MHLQGKMQTNKQKRWKGAKQTTKYKKKEKKNNFQMEFDLGQIIIWNDSWIVIMTISKIPILYKLIPMKHHHCKLIFIFSN
jgi:hypothetical protein